MFNIETILKTLCTTISMFIEERNETNDRRKTLKFRLEVISRTM